jgi:nucleoside-diphosphate-sugar epimerase
MSNPLTINWPDHHGDRFAGRTVLVTGGAGFIGSHVVEALVKLDAKVRVIDDLSGGDWANLAGFDQSIKQITGSIADAAVCAEATAGCEYVFHLAGFGSIPRSIERPDLYLQANVVGTFNVLEAARTAGVHRVVFSGSSNYYGDFEDGPKRHEDQPPRTYNPYGASKLWGEGAMRAWSQSYAMDTAVLRYFNIFGPRQSPNSEYAAVIAAFAQALTAERTPIIYGDGGQSRDFTYVANAVHANLLAAAHPEPLHGEVYNVATGRSTTVNELYRQMAHLMGCDNVTPDYAEARAGEIRHSLADITRAERVLGYHPLVDFETGLAATVQWYEQHLNRESTA